MSRRILVTGGGKGVGAAIVRSLAQAGYGVDFTYRASADAAQALAQELVDAHPGISVNGFALDLSDKDAIEAFFARASKARAITASCIMPAKPYDALTAMMAQDKAEAAMQVNFWAFTRLAKALMRAMLRAREGRIVAIGSVAALQATAGNAAYAASKGALISYARTLAIETAKRGRQRQRDRAWFHRYRHDGELRGPIARTWKSRSRQGASRVPGGSCRDSPPSS